MTRIPDTDYRTDTEELPPGKAHDRWERATNLQADDLRELRDTAEHDEYLQAASEQRQTDDPPIPGGPLSDAIHLATTPREEWGPDERAEAEEALNWVSRHGAQYEKSEGEDLTPDDGTKTSKADVAAARWGFDFKPDDDWP
jgi:hypothetical protein